MKKIIILLSLILCIMTNFNQVMALETESKLSDYYYIINKVNQRYDSELVIYNKSEFMNSEISNDYNYDYNDYLNNILSTDLYEFEKECIEIAKYKLYNFEVYLEENLFSTLASKTIKFNSSRNSMTLTYKHNGNKFDTSYKPTVKVNKLSSTYYFTMTSYSGSFKNSNETYSVNAKGKIYTSFGVSSGKTFTVNFNL